jgi:hypothetical protein
MVVQRIKREWASNHGLHQHRVFLVRPWRHGGEESHLRKSFF